MQALELLDKNREELKAKLNVSDEVINKAREIIGKPYNPFRIQCPICIVLA